MATSTDLTTAREDVQRSRAQISNTIAELEQRVTAPVAAVKERLDVGRLVRDHPWTALALATGAGVAIAATGTDVRVASAAAEKAREGGEAALEFAREKGPIALEAAKTAPSRTHGAIAGALDALAAKLAVSLISALRESKPDAVTPDAPAAMPLPRPGLGMVDESTRD